MLSSLKFIHILIILLGSTGTIKEVRAQGAIQFIFNLFKEFFGLQSSTPAAESSKPADSATSAAVDTSKTIANNQPATITVTKTKTEENHITKVKTEVTIMPPQTSTETIRLQVCVRTLTDDTNVTEMIRGINSNSTIIQTVAPDAQVITLTDTEKTITVTETKLEPTTVTSIQITTLCEEKSRNIVENESCDICLRQDELDDLFDDSDGGDVVRTRLVRKKGTSSTEALIAERRPEIESTFTAEN